MSKSVHDIATEFRGTDDEVDLGSLLDFDVDAALKRVSSDTGATKQLSGTTGFGMEAVREQLPRGEEKEPSLLDVSPEDGRRKKSTRHEKVRKSRRPEKGASASATIDEGADTSEKPREKRSTEKKKSGKHRSRRPEKEQKDPTGAVETLKAVLPDKDDQEAIDALASSQGAKLERLAEIYGEMRKCADYHAKSEDTCLVDVLFDDKLGEQVGEFQETHRVRSPKEAIEEVVKHVHARVGTNKEGRKDAYKSGAEGMGYLGDLVANGTTMCREKAIYAQILLAGYGIETKLVSASRTAAETGGDGRHTWLETPDGGVIDVMWGQVGARGKTTHRTRYTQDVIEQNVMKPANPADPEEVAQAVAQAGI